MLLYAGWVLHLYAAREGGDMRTYRYAYVYVGAWYAPYVIDPKYFGRHRVSLDNRVFLHYNTGTVVELYLRCM
jgi:hypothetical protein